MGIVLIAGLRFFFRKGRTQQLTIEVGYTIRYNKSLERKWYIDTIL